MTGRELLRWALTAERRRMVVAALLLGAHQGFEALVPVVVGATLDAAIAPSDRGALVLWLVVLAVLFLALSASYRNGARIGVGAMERVAHRLRMDIVARLLATRGADRSSGEVLSLANADVDALARAVRGVALGTGVVVALVAGAVVLLLTSLVLGLVVIAGLPVVVALTDRLGRPLSRRAGGEQARAAEAASVATDLVAGLRPLQGFGGQDTGVARYRAASARSLRGALAAARAESAFEASTVLVSGLVLAGVAVVGGRLAANGDLSIGQLIAAAGVTQFLVGPLGRLGAVAAMFARARASADRLADVLGASATAPERDERPEPSGAPGLVIRALRAGSLDGLDLEVAPGALHGIAAVDPADAAALLDCLAGEAVPAAGSVTVDGESTPAGTAMVVPHDAPLLAGTVRGNVEVAAHDAGAVRAALRAAAVEEIGAPLPDGLDTPLTEAGRSLSGGQRQRVMLARALAARPPLLVLHDPTTALDAATEATVASNLAEARAGSTTVLVTTSPALLAVCDAVTVIDGGRARATATHAELAHGDASYRATVLA